MDKTAKSVNVTGDYARYLVVCGVSFVWVVALCVLVNILVDPAKALFSRDLERELARLAQDGKNLAAASDFNTRRFQKYRVEMLEATPENIVMGSSRALQVRRGMFGKDLINHAMKGAVIEDYYAIVELYVEHGELPKRLLLVTDPWIFNRGHGQDRWQELGVECKTLADRLFVPGMCLVEAGNSEQKLFREFLSFGYLKESVRKLLTEGTGAISVLADQEQQGFAPIPTLPLGKGGRLADGSYIYAPNLRKAPLQEVEQMAVIYATRQPVYSLRHYENLDAVYVNAFERLMQFLKDQDVEVTVMLPPYHLKVVEILAKRVRLTDTIKAAEVSIRETAGRFGYRVVGGFLSSACPEEHFYDGMHAKQSCMAALLGVDVPQQYAVIDQ